MQLCPSFSPAASMIRLSGDLSLRGIKETHPQHQEAEAGGLEAQGQPWIHGELGGKTKDQSTRLQLSVSCRRMKLKM